MSSDPYRLPGYDAWKLATPPWYDITEEEERALEEEAQRRFEEFRDNIKACVADERGDLTNSEIIQALNDIIVGLSGGSDADATD